MLKSLLLTLSVFALLIIGASLVLSQQPKPAPAAHAPVRSAAPEAQKNKADVAPKAAALTEAEQLRLENIQLKVTLLREQQNQLMSQYSALIQSIQAEHPGYYYNPASNSLIAVPKPAAKK